MEPYDPTWLADLARQQHPDRPELATALARCTSAQWSDSRAYVYFVLPPESPNAPGSDWQIQENVRLEDAAAGDIVLDLLRDGRIGGAEFLARI